ncbi:helitron_like_N domain-containing protein [Trichonephila clavipes]|uniref:Helitron_like_N domain-containing protein n=1 Tax=Trichonephila clavipes TaxID=2585209 RepID=A0A8X6WIL2_TRICX|nr:helitron_like_N domain-containing protein [Trichonephila clavipes]
MGCFGNFPRFGGVMDREKIYLRRLQTNQKSRLCFEKESPPEYREIPAHLPTLDLVSERLISLRIPFMQIRRLRHVHGQFGILGQIINVPVSINTMVDRLPRNVDDDYCINVHIKKEENSQN